MKKFTHTLHRIKWKFSSSSFYLTSQCFHYISSEFQAGDQSATISSQVWNEKCCCIFFIRSIYSHREDETNHLSVALANEFNLTSKRITIPFHHLHHRRNCSLLLYLHSLQVEWRQMQQLWTATHICKEAGEPVNKQTDAQNLWFITRGTWRWTSLGQSDKVFVLFF